MDISFANNAILQNYFDENDFMKTFFDSYEHCITDGINNIITKNEVSDNETFVMKFKNHKFHKPTLLPIEARENKSNYSAKLSVDVDIFRITRIKRDGTIILEDEPSREIKGQDICFFPVMLGSSICILDREKVTPKERIKYGECEDDPLGYFIIKGSEKCFVSQEKLMTDQYFTLIKDKVTFVECRSVRKSDNISMISIDVRKDIIHVYFSDKSIQLRTFLEFICNYYNLDFDEKKNMFMSEMKNDKMIKAMSATLSGRSVKKKGDDEDGDLSFFDNKDVDEIFLPHIEDPNDKIEYLLLMVKELLKVEYDIKKLSNRDSYSNKRIEPVGTLITQLFSKLFSNMTNMANRQLRGEEVKTKRGAKRKRIAFDVERSSLNSILKTQTLQEELNKAFTTSKWTATGLKEKTGVVIMLEAVNRMRQISNLRKISLSGARTFTKIDKPRKIDYSSYGMICVSSLVEGKLAGLVKELALSAYITIGVDADLVTNHVKDLRDKYPGNDMIMINGKLSGKCDGKIVKDILVNMRRRGELHHHTSITLVEEKDAVETNTFLKIFTSTGRIVRPLIIIGENNIPEYQIKGYNSDSLKNLTVKDMLNQGIIEYVDATESEFLFIAMTPENLEENRRFTHMEIDPSLMFGLIANVQQFPQHMPGPRSSLTTGKIVQQIGIPFLNYQKRKDASARVLWYPQNTLFRTEMMNRLIRLNKEHQPLEGSLIPSAQNVVIAIMPFLGYNVDDAIIVNRKFIELGGFRTTSYEIHEIPDVSMSETTELIKKYNRAEYVKRDDNEPHTEEIMYKSSSGFTTRVKYSKDRVDELLKSKKLSGYGIKDISELGELTKEFIDPTDGKTYYIFERRHKIKTRINPGDILVRYDVSERVSKKGAEKSRIIQHTYKDAPGIIEDVETLGEGYKKTIRIKIKTDNIPEVGDKIFAPYSQKSVIGYVADPEDLPFDPVTGIIPDVIMSPSAFPSRMTIGMLLDIVMGKAICMEKRGILTGEEMITPIFDEMLDTKIKISSYSKKMRDIIASTFGDKYNSDMYLSYGDIKHLKSQYPRVTIEGQRYEDLAQWQKDLYDKLFTPISEDEIIGFKGLTLDEHRGIRRSILEVLKDKYEFPLTSNLTYDMLNKKERKLVQEFYGGRDKSLPITDDNIINMTYPVLKLFTDINVDDKRTYENIRLDVSESGKYKLSGNDLLIYWIKHTHLAFPNVSSSAFSKPKYEEIINYMKQYGETEKVKMINGITGKQMSASITMGIVGYYVLKHFAKNKIRYRDTGRKDLATRQPIRGKNDGGGIRIGEMERTVIESHGDAFFLQQVMRDTSDLTSVFICQNCKEMCYKDVHNIIHCDRCDSMNIENKISRVNVPYSLCMLDNLSTALGITLKMDLDKTRNLYANLKK